ncbi:MAG: 3-carboxy-cis,cis-muconate cycloisomerase [Candidatus Acidiferrum sp.]|jgi:3-carboxy-cis,cis-muconate cycloisomerase
MALLDSLFRSPAIVASFTDAARIQGMLDFEAALARAEAASGIIPVTAGATITAKCREEFIDFAALQKSAANAGNLAIPLVHQLTALVAKEDAEAAGFVHWGVTSQDAIDTGFVLQLRPALAAMQRELRQLCERLAPLANQHRTTAMVGRTWLQHAVPTTFGAKVAGWLDALVRHLDRIEILQEHALVLQFGGAVGTLAALDDHGENVAAALAKELSLPLPDIPWHSHRDRFAEVATCMGLLAGTLGKIARDISLHTQTEIDELRETAAGGRGGSSSMPHKRNPVSCAVILANSARVPGLVSTILSAMVQEDERGLGGWQAEWEPLPEVVGLAGGALHHLHAAIAGLEVNTARMRENLEATHGLIYAEAVTIRLAERIGIPQAREAIEAACRQAAKEREHLRDVLLTTPAVLKHLPEDTIHELFDANRYFGSSSGMIDKVLATARSAVATGVSTADSTLRRKK